MKAVSLIARAVLLVIIGMSLISNVQAVTVFSSDFDTGTSMTVIGDADTDHMFGYDYSADGIPEAPNNVGGSATTGLKLEANIVTPTGAEEIGVVTTGLTLSGKYSVQADIWINANGPFPGGGSGSTEFAGLAVGHDGVSSGRSGASFIYNGDANAGSRDYRLYKDDGEQFPSSGQYATGTQDADVPPFSTAFPGLSAPASQGQGNSVTKDGAGAFQWMTLLVEVDTEGVASGITSDLGTATFTLSSAASGNSVVIGTIDNGNGGTVVNMSGNPGVIFYDLFSSVSGNPQFSFGIFDNLVVTQVPEPSTLVLLGMSSLALCGVRRRKSL